MEISVIISAYNSETYVAAAIRSVLNQSFDKNEMELLVVDDCSTDGSYTIIEPFERSSSIRVVRNKKNIGLSKSCNMAVRVASGKFVYFVDADDFINKNALMVAHLYLTSNRGDIHACSCDYLEVDGDENVIRRRNGNSYPIRCGVLYKTDDLIALGPYQDVPREDIDFRNRFTQSGKFIYNIPIPLYRYRQHQKSLTKNIKEHIGG